MREPPAMLPGGLRWIVSFLSVGERVYYFVMEEAEQEGIEVGEGLVEHITVE